MQTTAERKRLRGCCAALDRFPAGLLVQKDNEANDDDDDHEQINAAEPSPLLARVLHITGIFFFIALRLADHKRGDKTRRHHDHDCNDKPSHPDPPPIKMLICSVDGLSPSRNLIIMKLSVVYTNQLCADCPHPVEKPGKIGR